MSEHFGTCHCGAIKFSICQKVTELTTCDCSLCVKKNALMTKVHESKFTLISGKEHLQEYQWNMNIARHYFCGQCGIYTFHRKRSQPDHYGVNIYCLDGIDISDIPVRATKGDDMSVKSEKARDAWPGPRV